MSKIVKFYKKDAANDPDAVLEQAIGQYESVVVIGWDHHGDLDPRASMNLNQAQIHWLLSVFQQKLLNGDYGTDS
jgi:hypothetical protein